MQTLIRLNSDDITDAIYEYVERRLPGVDRATPILWRFGMTASSTTVMVSVGVPEAPKVDVLEEFPLLDGQELGLGGSSHGCSSHG